jgi:protein-L-isoaspartate(D-aspartate) O-methyltransferase
VGPKGRMTHGGEPSMLRRAQSQLNRQEGPPGGRSPAAPPPWGLVPRRSVSRRTSRALEAVPWDAFAPGSASGVAGGARSGASGVAGSGGDRAPAASLADSDQPQLAAALDRLCPLSGQSVLEIGTGSGFSAALLAELVGPSGQVVTVELDGRRAVDARLNLVRAGYERVHVVGADGTYGFAPAAPYDRILVRGSTPWLTRQWVRQARQGGRLVVPVEMQGVQLLATLRRDGEAARSIWLDPAAWTPLGGGPAAAACGLRVEAGGWLARSAKFGPDERGPLATQLGYSPVFHAELATLLPADGRSFLLFLALHDRRAVLLRRAGVEPGGPGLDGVGLFDPEEGSLVAAVAAPDGSGRLGAWTFGRADMLAALEHHARAWQSMKGARPAVLATPPPPGRESEASDLRTPYRLSVVWE